MIEVPPARIPEEPGAVIPHAGICEGASGNRRLYLDRGEWKSDGISEVSQGCPCLLRFRRRHHMSGDDHGMPHRAESKLKMT